MNTKVTTTKFGEDNVVSYKAQECDRQDRRTGGAFGNGAF